MTLSAGDAALLPLSTDDEIEARVAELIGRACRRQVWMLFVDDVDVQLPLIVPMADYPADPYGGDAELLGSRIREIVETLGSARVIIVWERLRGAEALEADRVWARELAAACDVEGVRVRAQLISHRDGVRWFPSDDYL